jgi:hydroxymethylglutaryl-CoA lyase
VVIAY